MDNIDLASIVDVHIQPLLSQTASLTDQVTAGHIDIFCHLRPCYIWRIQPLGDSSSRDISRSDAFIITTEAWKEPKQETRTGDDPFS